MHNIENLRKKILSSAYTEGIQTNKEFLFQRLHLKKQTADYALSKLEEEGFFNKTKFDLDFQALGVGKFAWVLIGVNWEKHNQDEFIKKLLELTPILTVADITGTSDLAIKVFGPSISQISSFVLGIEKLFQGTITHVHIYFANKEYKRHYLEVKNTLILKTNKIDCAILKEKTQDPKSSLIQIADKYKIHRNSVSKRWNALWKRGIIIKEIPDLTQKGYDEIKMGLKAFMIIKTLPGCEEKIIKSLMKRKDIQDIFTTISNEIIIIIRTENSATLAQEHRSLTKLDCSIKRTNTSIFLTKYNKTTLSLKEMTAVMGNCK